VIAHGTGPAAAPDPVPFRRTILFLGRLEPYKGLAVLVAAMQEVWREQPDVRLTVAGRGPSAAEVPEHPMISAVLRYVTDDEIDELFSEATLVVAPYTEASQSGVVSLAAARGIPSVVSDVGALAELAVDSSLVVPGGDASALARALLANLDHGPDLRRRVHEMAVEQLSWSVVGRETVEFYREVLGR
jgi:glycosyltransferase involved in cell wall biosynthesis